MKDVNILTTNGVDVKSSLELFGDMATYDETVNDFLESVNGKVEDIKKYKETGDMPNYAILVHSLKSDAKYLGLTNLAAHAYNHEMASKANNINYVYDNFDSLMAETERVITILKTYMGENNGPVQVEQPKDESNKSKTILIVDDSDIVRTFIKKIFDDEYFISIAHDGKEALDIIATNSYGGNIVGMFLDLNMPNVNGFEVLDYFKNNNLFVNIPVAIITGDDSKESINKVYEYPIIGILQKPFNERDVKIILDKMIASSNL